MIQDWCSDSTFSLAQRQKVKWAVLDRSRELLVQTVGLFDRSAPLVIQFINGEFDTFNSSSSNKNNSLKKSNLLTSDENEETKISYYYYYFINPLIKKNIYI